MATALQLPPPRAAVTRMRAQEAGLPDGLSAINYISMTTPALAPFIPIYEGLPEDALPPEMTNATAIPDATSLFWRARRLQSLVMQDWPALAPPAQAAIRQWEAEVEERLRPRMEKRYTAAVEAGDQGKADAELAQCTAELAASAGRLLDGLAQDAAAALGMDGVPPDDELVPLLYRATSEYLFHHGDQA